MAVRGEWVFWERTHPACRMLDTLGTLEACAPRGTSETVVKKVGLNSEQGQCSRCTVSGRSFLEQQRRESGKVAAPDHPGVGARSFNFGVPDLLGFEPGAELPAAVDETVLRPAGDPKQAQLPVRFRVERREGCVEALAKPAGAESADPGKAVQGVQADLER